MQTLSSACFVWVLLSVFIRKKHIFASNISFQGAAMLVFTLPIRRIKKQQLLARDVFATFPTHARLVITSLMQTAGHK